MVVVTKVVSSELIRAKVSDQAMEALEAAALAKNELAFLAARRAIAWEQRPPEDFMRAVNLALMAGAFVAARNLAQEGTDHYPHHAELRKMAYVLAPPTVRVGEGPRTTTWKADREWLKTHWDAYRGQWVALLNGQLLGVADSFDALIAQVGDTSDTDILVTPIG